ncbi:hypothetical protein [Clostridium sp. JNZ J1-5]|nr:hypothetical protein [Clostridium sp.]
MVSIEDVASIIKEIDCPEDKLKTKIVKAYDGYQYNGESEVIIDRAEELDKDELKAYKTYVNKAGSPTIIVMVDEGADNYVTTVEEVYLA